ncbi:hypothetical protein [Gaoshiqia sp. Z1-71]|uniref:hypothetical protein n=1 Tax=Gaoshiqia hydrogeniformans TaxID=3290090 RepID=UPI003BF77884
MKRIIPIVAICIISTNLFSQTYKLETIFSDKLTETYLSHWKVIEPLNDVSISTFSLWGYQLYFDDWTKGVYEVEYFKGNANETFRFLTEINQFSEKYKNEDKILTHILGVQVKTVKQLGFKYTLVYDKENKVICMFTQKQWLAMLTELVSYCDKMNIDYKQNE